MNNNDPFRIFENADDDFIENLSDSPRLNNIEKERMFKMSMNIYNEMRKNNSMGIEMNTSDGVNGVERYNRPKWYKPVMTAAACIVAIVGIAGSAKLIKNLNRGNGYVNQPDIIATQITTTVTTDSDNALAAVTTETTSVTTDVSITTDIIKTTAAEENKIQTEIEQTEKSRPEAEKAAQTTVTQAPVETAPPAETTAPAAVTTASEENRMLISRAQLMFETACRYHWEYHTGMPFESDNETVLRDDNTHGQRIIDPYIKTVQDVVDSYLSIFSDRYGNQNFIYDYFFEKDGYVYKMIAGRGGNIFYLTSLITEVQRIEDDEIFFTIEHYYDPEIEQYGTGKAVVTETFSVVVQPDGSWRVGMFNLPN